MKNTLIQLSFYLISLAPLIFLGILLVAIRAAFH
jgi:hypothetical protein